MFSQHDLQQIFSIAKYFITLRWLFFSFLGLALATLGVSWCSSPAGAVPGLLCAVLGAVAGSCGVPKLNAPLQQKLRELTLFFLCGSELIHFKSSQ